MTKTDLQYRFGAIWRYLRAKPSRLYWITILVWMMTLTFHATWTTYSVLAISPSPDLYANTVSFQLIAYGVFWLPPMLLLLVIVLVAEKNLLRHWPNASEVDSFSQSKV